MINANLTNVTIFSATEGKSKTTGKPFLQLRASVGTGIKTGNKIDGKDEYGREWLSFTVFDAAVERWREKLVKGAKVNLVGKITLDSYLSKDGTACSTIQVNFPDIEFVSAPQATATTANVAQQTVPQAAVAGISVPEGLDDELPFA